MSQIYHDAEAYRPGRRVMLATTVYDTPAPGYTFSMSKCREKLHQAGIQTEYLLLVGNCHVDDARNVVVQQFLLSQCDDLIFIDADVYWESKELLKLCQYDVDFVGGIYPYRQEGLGLVDSLPVGLLDGVLTPEENGLIEVHHLPTGFMRMRRHVIERLAKDAVHHRNPKELRSRQPILFQRTFSDDTRWGGDVHFCNIWRASGGKIYAACEMRLGHEADSFCHDSLGAYLRRIKTETLKHMVAEIQAGRPTIELFQEVRRYMENETYGAEEALLMLCALSKADGPIIEAGSGLTTIVLAAANPEQTVWCLEHHPVWATRLKQWAYEAGVFNIALCTQRLNGGWYDLTDLHELPEHFSLGVNDGPPRKGDSRMGFFLNFGKRVDTIICDDVDEPWYRREVQGWAKRNDCSIEFVDERAALIRRK